MSGRFRPGLVAKQSDCLEPSPPSGPGTRSRVWSCRLFAGTVHPSPLVLQRACTERSPLRRHPIHAIAPSCGDSPRPWLEETAAAQAAAPGSPHRHPCGSRSRRKRGNHLWQFRQLRVFGHASSRAALCAEPISTPRPNSSEGRRPPETEGVPKPVVKHGQPVFVVSLNGLQSLLRCQ